MSRIPPLLAANSSHQVNPTDGHRYHRASSSSPRDATMTNEDSSVSGTGRSSARSRTRPMPASYTYWLNTGESTTQNNAHFMRLTYAATCRSRLSRSVERCPRACRGTYYSSRLCAVFVRFHSNVCLCLGFSILCYALCDDHREDQECVSLFLYLAHDEVASQPTPTNGEPQRRIQSVNRQQLNESISRLSKPKTVVGIPMSQSSYQLRASTPPVSSSNTSTPRKVRRILDSSFSLTIVLLFISSFSQPVQQLYQRVHPIPRIPHTISEHHRPMIQHPRQLRQRNPLHSVRALIRNLP